MDRPDPWDLACAAVVAAILALMALRHGIFPLFHDIHYHLAIMRTMDMAGGVVTRDVLHYAPLGRPHLYPPLYHVLLLLPYKAGAGIATVGAWGSALLYPALLATIWITARDWFSKRAALFSLLVFSSSWAVFYRTGYLSPATLALALMVWAYVCALRRRYVAATLCMALALYAHLSLPHLLMAPLAAVAALDRRERRPILLSMACAYLLYAPWGIHFVRNIDSFSTMATVWRYRVDLVLFALAIPGAALLVRRRDGGRVWVVPLVALCTLLPVLFSYPYRYFLHAAPFLALLAGVALAWAYGRLSASRGRRGAGVMLLVVVALCLTQHPSFDRSYQQDAFGQYSFAYAWRDPPTMWETLWSPSRAPPGDLESYYAMPGLTVIARGIEDYLRPGDIILVPPGTGFEASFFSSVTGRATTGGMLREVVPPDLPASAMPPLRAYLASGRVAGVPEGAVTVSSELYTLVVLDNEAVAATTAVPASALPWQAAAALVAAAVAALVADVRGEGLINRYLRARRKEGT